MIESISFLLPTYNCLCARLVETLHGQCRALAAACPGFAFEIVVADDCSTDRSVVAANSVIERLDGVRYLRLARNVGRSAIRNRLAREARYGRMVFVDGDLQVARGSFVRRYAETGGDVVVGGVAVGGSAGAWRSNLRYRYEKRCEAAHTAEMRQRLACREFRTTNFLVSRRAMDECRFDEHFRHYGYEDVLFGKALARSGFEIRHIDNPVLIDDFEPNVEFLGKTEEACRTLWQFRDSLRGYSSLLGCVETAVRWHVAGAAAAAFGLLGGALRRQLCGGSPSVVLYNVYRLLYLSRCAAGNNA